MVWDADDVLATVVLHQLLISCRQLDVTARLEVDVVVAILARALPLEARQAHEAVGLLAVAQEVADAPPLLAHGLGVYLGLGGEGVRHLHHVVGIVRKREEVAHALAVLKPPLKLVDLPRMKVEVQVGDEAGIAALVRMAPDLDAMGADGTILRFRRLVCHLVSPYMIPSATMMAAKTSMPTSSLLALQPRLEMSR